MSTGTEQRSPRRRPVASGSAGPPAGGRRVGGGLREVLDFYFYEMFTPLRSKISLHAFELVLLGTYAFSLATVLAVSVLVCVLLRTVWVGGYSGQALLLGFLAVNVYAAGGYLLKEVFSERRFVVSNSPNAAFYRALDVPARHVFVVCSGLRTTLFFAGLLLADAAFVLVLHGSVGVGAAVGALLLLLPVSLYAVTLATAGSMANRRTTSAGLARGAMVGGGALCLVAGYVTARILAPLVRDGGAAPLPGAGPGTLVGAVAAASVLAAVAGTAVLVHQLRRLDRSSFPLDARTSAAAGGTAGRARLLDRIAPLVAVLHREMSRSTVVPLVRRNFLTLGAVLLATIGASLSGVSGLPVERFADRVMISAHGLLFVVDVVMVALVFKVVGPTTLAPQFRFQWESLLSSEWTIALSAAAYYAAPVLLLGTGFSVLLALAVGAWSIGPPAVGVAVVAAAMIAESVMSPKRMADGTSAHGTGVAMVVVLLSVPAMLGVSSDSALSNGLRAAYSLCLLGGATVCVARRTRTSSSTSAL